MFLEYLPNGNLSDYLMKYELPTNDRIRIIQGIARGMYHLHCEKIIHRGISEFLCFVQNPFRSCSTKCFVDSCFRTQDLVQLLVNSTILTIIVTLDSAEQFE